jgi:hypothetical protein
VLLRVEKWCSVLVRVVVIRTLRGQGEAQLLRVVVAGEVIDPRHAAVLGERGRVAGGVDALQLAGEDLGAELGAGDARVTEHLLDEAPSRRHHRASGWPCCARRGDSCLACPHRRGDIIADQLAEPVQADLIAAGAEEVARAFLRGNVCDLASPECQDRYEFNVLALRSREQRRGGLRWPCTNRADFWQVVVRPQDDGS